MPRVSRQVAQQNHGAILRASAKLLRERGLGVSLADIMGAAGLTPGGFYGHFGSKDALLAHGCTTAFAESAGRWHARAGAAADAAAALDAVLQGYLADEGPLTSGCPIASLATDIAREPAGAPVGSAFREGLGGLIDILTGLQLTEGPAARQAALLQLCTMLGALVLARATRGDALSGELLRVARASLKTPAARARHAAAARKGRASR
jgi:TetR/AcrR family transcriptional regulator, transcriptional repressor for nem operon